MEQRVEFIEVLRTFNTGDISFIVSLLEANGITYHIEGQNFLQVRPLVQPAIVLVDRNQLEDAKFILKDFKSGKFGYELEE